MAKPLKSNEVSEILTRALALPDAPSSDFDLNPSFRLPEGRKLRPAGVLVAVDLAAGQPAVILTKRSAKLRHHPGQIAFAGGKQDPHDADPVAAALREAHEEIGLPYGISRVLGSLTTHETMTGFLVTPVVAVIDTPFTPVAEQGEVAEVFRVPLDHLLNPRHYRIESRQGPGGPRYYYAVPYGPYYIWGATARMLRGLAERVHR